MASVSNFSSPLQVPDRLSLRRIAGPRVASFRAMPRRPRQGTGGLVFHVMNCGARRLPLFDRPGDYRLFVDALREATDRFPGMRLLCWVVMSNHWHLVLWPREDGDLSAFMAWITSTHSRRWHLVHNTVGSGTIYQGRFKAIPVRDDVHFLTVCRYVERNPVRARLVRRVEDWDWSSASCQWHLSGPRLHPWPVRRPASWEEDANAEENLPDLLQLRDAISRSSPFGSESWREQTTSSLGWQTGLRPRGRPHLRPEDRKI
jgi:REP-associated tyrosine transposase